MYRLRKNSHGFTYMVMLVAVSLTSIAAAITGNVLSTMIQRERESELLFRGQQYLQAIQSYYEAGAQRQYPQTLEQLIKDPRYVARRHLRRLYSDPLMASDQKVGWRLIENERGGIMGVASRAEGQPLKQARFPAALKQFSGANSYSQWAFVFRPKRNVTISDSRRLPAETK